MTLASSGLNRPAADVLATLAPEIDRHPPDLCNPVLQVALRPRWGNARLILSLDEAGRVIAATWFVWAGTSVDELTDLFRRLNLELGTPTDASASSAAPTVAARGLGMIEAYLHLESEAHQRGVPCVQLSVARKDG
ncbi:hypothetical protein [Parenemella sanctibonifatiensis]|uniref:Uncharacterized protein n=1 Tax=Parenemella sanctibonifatiensis TaxID=2016505 RepID=A0A255EDE1_9ACTN|nr:hypothetical protein [Parenemella sanctibonifatiensis]OYN89574.1 hypothetical protein CGZ92_02295 [Parenemella sanctibonifatiensis]